MAGRHPLNPAAGAATVRAETSPAAGTKYLGLRDRILDIIESKATGAAIPSERELCASFDVSRMTVRRALDELERDGYLVRRQGAPTLTARPKIAQHMTLLSFTEDMRRRGLASSSQLIGTRVEPCGPRLAARLRVAVDEPVIRVGRLRLADGEPMAIEWLHVPRALVPDLDPRELRDASFYAVILDRFGIRIAGGAQTVEATLLDDDEAALLEAPRRSPALSVERTTWTADGQVIELVQSKYRGDRYRFEIELMPAAPGPRP